MIWKMKKNWMEVTTRKTLKVKWKKLYNKLIQKDIDVLEREKLMHQGEKKLVALENIISWMFSKL